MPYDNFPRRPLNMLEWIRLGEVAVGAVVALILIAFGIFCYFAGWL